MRGKERLLPEKHTSSGITPAYAGKSITVMLHTSSPEDHPRVCGEKCLRAGSALSAVQSPPRMRGKVIRCEELARVVGITPACAGKSCRSPQGAGRAWDHPRVCGEKYHCDAAYIIAGGSPPRMRGKVIRCEELARVVGITPACAGKSCRSPQGAGRAWDHPRVCGEKTRNSRPGTTQSGSPPRMRGKG